MRFLFVLFLVLGCGRTSSVLGPSQLSKEMFSVRVKNYSSFSVSNLIQRAAEWDNNRKSIGKAITITVWDYYGAGASGDAYVGGNSMNIYLDKNDTDVLICSYVFHELSHIRGLNHYQMSSLDYYKKLAKEFLNYK